MTIDPTLLPRFLAQGDAGGIYYLAQRNDTSLLWWYGEHPGAEWAHVFRGRVTVDTQALTARWEGRFIDLPKGLTCGYGDLAWEHRLGGGPSPLVRTARRGTHNHFGESVIVPESVRAASVARLGPGFVGDGLENLTGVWLCDDGGTYYVREVSETGEIAWVGEHPQAEPDMLDMPGRRWVNVFMGQRDRRLIRGQWSDVPKGEVDQHGEMTLFVTSESRMTVIRKTGGFGGLRFHRTEDLELSLRWVSLRVIDQQEWFFEADEPYFFALIAVMDGKTVNLTDRAHAHADFSHSFVAPMLRSNSGAGTVIPLDSLPPTEVGVRAVRGDDPTRPLPVFAIALRGAEKDDSSSAWQRDRLQDWIATGGAEVDRALRSGDVAFHTDVARWHEVFTWRNEDDIFGLDSVAFTHADLQRMSGRTTELTFDLKSGDMRYKVTAELSVRGVRGDCRP